MEILIRPSRVCGRLSEIFLWCHCETSPQTGCGPDINRRVCRTHVPYAFGCNPFPHALALPLGELSPKVTERACKGVGSASPAIPALSGRVEPGPYRRLPANFTEGKGAGGSGCSCPPPWKAAAVPRSGLQKNRANSQIGAAGFPRLKLSSAVWRAAGATWRQAGLLTDGSAAGARSSRFPSDGLSSLCAASPYTAAVPFRILT